MKINIYAEDALEAMQTPDKPTDPTRSVFIVHYPPHVRQAMPDHCPGENTEDVFEELAWESLMADIKRYAP